MFRSSTSTLRGRRALVAGGFALCVALAPGVAWAEDDPAPAPEDAVTDIVEGGVPAGEQPGEGQAAEGEALEEEEAPTEEPPPFEIPPELEAALQQFADQAGFSEDCVTGVTDALERIGNGIAGLPTELQELGTAFGEALQQSITDQDPTALENFLAENGLTPPDGGSAEPPAPPVGADITAGLEDLAAALQACQPAPPAPPAPPANNPPPNPPASYQPPQAPPPPPAQPAPIQPAVYPGYAPTGADEVEGPSPTAIALVLAFLAGGAVWTGRRWGASRPD